MKSLKNILEKFSNDSNITFEESKDLTKYSTMKLKSVGSIFFVKSAEALSELIISLKAETIDYKIIGWGANFILPQRPSFILIKLDFPFDKAVFESTKNSFWLPASAPLNVLTSIASKKGFKGWEVFTGVPASLGGALAMNAGTSLGEIGDLVEEVKILGADGVIRNHSVTEKSFSYRKNHFLNSGDVIIEVLLRHDGIDLSVSETIKKYLKMRTDTQPLREKTCGCMFKNFHDDKPGVDMTCRAGLSIDIMGMKGMSVNDLRVSPKHANFMENRGKAESPDVRELLDFTKRELKLQYGVEFETEVHFPK